MIIPTFSREQLIASNNQIEEAYQKLKRNEVTWDDAVLKYSHDVNTRLNKGIITNPYSGEQYWKMEDLNQIDQQMFLLIDKMQIGDFSAPTLYFDINERKQGIRIVRVMDKTKPPRANLDDDYGMIQNATTAWKKQVIISKWVENKRHNAYIRIDDEYKNCELLEKWIK
ncbi:MAG TPA: peptidylprolyl isomerase [Crocinitomicaceae bacterium]|nr:peptidylprolyl isomerase [Crocinitomicaceae bacterium]